MTGGLPMGMLSCISHVFLISLPEKENRLGYINYYTMIDSLVQTERSKQSKLKLVK